MESIDFYFCNDDIDRCVKGTRQLWVVQSKKGVDKPPIPDVWPVIVGTNLTRGEIEDLEAAGFQLPQKQQVSPRRLFTNDRPPRDLSSTPVPLNASRVPAKRDGKSVKRTTKVRNEKQRKSMGSVDSLDASVTAVRMLPGPGLGCHISLLSRGAPPEAATYSVTISSFPHCSCPAFTKT